MIRSLHLNANGEIHLDLPVDQYLSAVQQPGSLLWVDIFEEDNLNVKSILSDTFRFHPLAVADALDQVHQPKIDDWQDYLYIVLRAVVAEANAAEELETQEVDVFLGPNYIVTFHDLPVPAIDRIWDKYGVVEHLIRKGKDQLFYQMIDEIATDFILLSETIDEQINRIEDQLFETPKSDLLENIFALKRDLLHLRRIIAPQREVVNKLARGDYAIIEPGARIYFRDVYDHFLRLYEIIENLRDLISSALDVYLSVVNNRMNNVMKILTVITTLFMPISFLASFFGMNFFQPFQRLELWTGPLVFRITVAAMLLFPAAMFFWMRRRGWLD